MSSFTFPSSFSAHDVRPSLHQTPSRQSKRSMRPVVPNEPSDRFSPEYTTSQSRYSFPQGGDYEADSVEKDIKRALRAQDRARMRKATLEASPHNKRVFVSPSVNMNSQVFSTAESDLTGKASNSFMPEFQENDSPTSGERVRMRSFRFPRFKDSISLPYLQNLRKATLPRSPPIIDTPPPVPPLPSVPRSYPPALDQSPKQLAPLARFDPFSSRPRADSLTSLVEDRSLIGSEIRRCPPATMTSSRGLKRVVAVNDIFSNINRQAESLGMKTLV